jgi:Putative inner membrane protein (DUF1819)
MRHENLFGKASRSRVEDILSIFRQRYLSEESVLRALVTLVKGQLPTATLDRILYFHAAKADRLLYDVVVEVLVAQQSIGVTDIDNAKIMRVLMSWVAKGKTTGQWSEPTASRIVQGLLSALRDFGVLQGAVNKRMAPGICPPRLLLTSCSFRSSTSPLAQSCSNLLTGGCSYCPRTG